MHKRYLLSAAVFTLFGTMFGTSCAVDTPDETTESTSQAVSKLRSCFVNLGQPDPSVPLSRRFDSSCSTPTPGSFIWKYSWNFGDGSGLLTGNTVTDHTFPFTNSCYKVTLDVIDINGKDDASSQNVSFCSVSPCNPVCPP